MPRGVLCHPGEFDVPGPKVMTLKSGILIYRLNRLLLERSAASRAALVGTGFEPPVRNDTKHPENVPGPVGRAVSACCGCAGPGGRVARGCAREPSLHVAQDSEELKVNLGACFCMGCVRSSPPLPSMVKSR